MIQFVGDIFDTKKVLVVSLILRYALVIPMVHWGLAQP